MFILFGRFASKQMKRIDISPKRMDISPNQPLSALVIVITCNISAKKAYTKDHVRYGGISAPFRFA